MNNFTGITYNSGFDEQPRSGFFGKLLDKLFGAQLVPNNRFVGFMAVLGDGRIMKSSNGMVWVYVSTNKKGDIITSPDGINWSSRTTP